MQFYHFNTDYVERYRGGGSEEATSEATSEGTPDDEDTRSHDTRDSVEPDPEPEAGLCRYNTHCITLI